MSEKSAALAETASAASTATKTTVGFSSFGFAAWFAQLDFIAVISICVAVVGLIISVCNFFVNLFFQHRKNRREQEIHELEVKKLRGQCNVKQD